MADSIMYQEDGYVVLEADQPEVLLSKEELFAKLQALLQSKQNELPRELQKFSSLEAKTQHLLETYCEFDIAPGKSIQWYVVRWQK